MIPYFLPRPPRLPGSARLSLLGVCLGVTLFAAPAFALDEVVRQGAESVRGRVTSVTKNEVSVEAAGRTTTVPATEIVTIRWEGEPPQLNLTRGREINGDLAFALDSYRSLAGEAGGNANLAADMQFLVARTLARQALGDPAKKEAAIKALGDFLAAHSDFYRVHEAMNWQGRVHVAANDLPAAQAVYTRLAEAPQPEIQLAARNALGRLELRRNDLPAALSVFETILSKPADTPAQARERFGAQLGKATVLQRQNDHAGALGVLDQVIDQASATDAGVLAEAFVRQGDSLQAQGKDKDALLSYLQVDVLFPMEAEAHAESLYHLTRLWNAVGRPERSAEARRKLTDRYGGTSWAAKLSEAG